MERWREKEGENDDDDDDDDDDIVEVTIKRQDPLSVVQNGLSDQRTSICSIKYASSTCNNLIFTYATIL